MQARNTLKKKASNELQVYGYTAQIPYVQNPKSIAHTRLIFTDNACNLTMNYCYCEDSLFLQNFRTCNRELYGIA